MVTRTENFWTQFDQHSVFVGERVEWKPFLTDDSAKRYGYSSMFVSFNPLLNK